MQKTEILERLLAPARADGWSVAYLTKDHPFDVLLQKGDETVRVRVYVWNVSHGGGTRAADEFRIQITGVEPPLAGPPGFATLIAGWHDDLGVVAAFDPARHSHQTGAASPSVQIALQTLEAAATDHAMRVHQRGNDEIAVAFPPDLLVPYLKEQAALHGFADDQGAIEALEAAGQGLDATAQVTSSERKRVLRTVAEHYRDSSFRRRVVAAYDGACAMCDTSLGLVEAAHIVPVGDPTSTDETSNGIGLCPSHHAAYDRGLVGIDEQGQIVVNEALLNELRADGLAEGEKELLNLRDRIRYPSAAADHPDPGYLVRGMVARGWS